MTVHTYTVGGEEWFMVDMSNNATLYFSREFDAVRLKFGRSDTPLVFSPMAFDVLLEVLLEIRKGM